MFAIMRAMHGHRIRGRPVLLPALQGIAHLLGVLYDRGEGQLQQVAPRHVLPPLHLPQPAEALIIAIAQPTIDRLPQSH